MEKVAFIIDGGFFFKKYKQLSKKPPIAFDVEICVVELFNFLFKNRIKESNYPIEIYRIFYYDCPPLQNLKKGDKH